MVELSQRVNGLFWVKKRRERNEFSACSHNLCTGAITPWVVLLLLLISIVLLYSTLLLHLYCATKSIQYPSYQSITTLVKQGITSVNKKNETHQQHHQRQQTSRNERLSNAGEHNSPKALSFFLSRQCWLCLLSSVPSRFQ